MPADERETGPDGATGPRAPEERHGGAERYSETARHGGAERTPFAPHRDDYYADEISLRDLYLILRRGLPLIVAVAMLAGVVGFFGASLRPKLYEAEATVLSSPSAVRVRDEGTLAFEPANSVSFEAYETIAMSRAVFEEVVDSLEGDAVTLPTYRELQAAAELEQLTGPARAGEIVPLTVLHAISWGDPEEAATYANAWAEASVDSMRRTLLANLDPVQEATSTSVATRLGQLEALRDRWQAFRTLDDSDVLEASLDQLRQEIAQGERRLHQLSVQIRVEENRRESLDGLVGAFASTTTSSDPASDAYLAGMDLAEARASVSTQLSQAQARLAEAQTALDDFDREHGFAALEAEIAYLTGARPAPPMQVETRSEAGQAEAPTTNVQILADGSAAHFGVLPELRERLRSLPTQIAGAEARLAAADPDAAPPLQADLAQLRAERAALESQIADTEAHLAAVTERWTTLRGERSRMSAALGAAEDRFATLLTRDQQLADAAAAGRSLRDASEEAAALRELLRTSTVQLDALRIERDALSEELASTYAETESLRAELSRLERERTQLERELELAEAAYDSVAELEPLIRYVTELTPSSTRLINVAAVPVSPAGPSATLVAALAVVLGGMLATLFVFLREAVRGPDTVVPGDSTRTTEGGTPARA